MTQDIVAYQAKALVPDAVVIDRQTIALIADSKTTVGDAHVRMVRDAATRYHIPLTGLNLLGGKLYVNAAGLAYVATHNPDPARRVKSITYDWIEKPCKENGMVGGVEAHVELWDGSTFKNEAWVDPDTESMSTMKTLSNARHKVITKAISRALRWATGVAITAVEELGDQPEVKQLAGWHEPKAARASEQRMAQSTVIASVSQPEEPRPDAPRLDGRPCSDAQRRLLFRLADTKLGWSGADAEDGLRALVRQRYEQDGIHTLTVGQASALIDAIQGGAVAPEIPATPADGVLPLEPCPSCGKVDWGETACNACGFPETEGQGELLDVQPARTDPVDARRSR